jgi:hypothetical protein
LEDRVVRAFVLQHRYFSRHDAHAELKETRPCELPLFGKPQHGSALILDLILPPQKVDSLWKIIICSQRLGRWCAKEFLYENENCFAIPHFFRRRVRRVAGGATGRCPIAARTPFA